MRSFAISGKVHICWAWVHIRGDTRRYRSYENGRMAVKKTSAVNLFSSLLNVAHVAGGGGLSAPAPVSAGPNTDSRRHSNVDLATVGGGTGKRQAGAADKGNMFLLTPPTHWLSHSQSVRAKQGPSRGSARAAVMGSADGGGALDSLHVGTGGPHRHRRSRSFVDFERALRSFATFRVLNVCTCVSRALNVFAPFST